jgi:uncharacterized membrane protein YccC
MVLLQPDFSTTKEKTPGPTAGNYGRCDPWYLPVAVPSSFFFALTSYCFVCVLFIYLQSRITKLSVLFVTVKLVAMLEIAEAIRWQIAAYRLLATLIGGMLAILAAYVLWPRWESMQFPPDG